MGKEQLEELKKHGRYFSVPSGVSMWPMIEKHRKGILEIRELKEPARRYDVVMYTRPNQQGVIHRVLRVRDDDYIIAGDNCWRREYVPKDQVRGIAVSFYRKGQWIGTDNRWYRCYARLWTDLFFIRRPILRLRDRGQRLLRKLHDEK